jgi:hypothetical protein
MRELSPTARRLFELARGQDEPDARARNRVAHALSAKIAAGASLAAAGGSASATAAGVGALAAKSTLLVGLGGALVVAGWFTVRALRPDDSSAASRGRVPLVADPMPAARVAASTAAEIPPADITKEPTKAPVHRRPTRAFVQAEAPVSAPSVVAEDGLRAETEALRLAQQALREKLPQQALRLLDEQDVRFRDGVLQQERAAARVLALCQANRVAEARAQGLRFERLWPQSVLLGRVRGACWPP